MTLSNRFKTSGITRWFLYIVVLGITVALFLMFLKSKTFLRFYLTTLIAGNQHLDHGDSWTAMMHGLNYLRLHPGGPVYDDVFATGIKFQYPLSSLLIFDLPQRFFKCSYIQIIVFLDFISRLAIFCTAFVSARILTVAMKQSRFEKLRTGAVSETVFLYILTIILTLTFYPLLWSYYLGQIQTILTFLAALSILCWLCNKKALTGVLIGLICVVKPQLALLFIWGIIRRQWSMVISGTIVVTFFLLISISLYGFHNNFDYLRILSFLSHHGESYFQNQSMNGLMNRLTFNGLNLTVDGTFPPYSPIVYVTTVISSLVLMLAGLLWNYKHKNPGVIDFCIIIVCTTMGSPIAWTHHYGILLPIFVLLSPFAIHFYADRKWILLILAGAYILISQYFEIFNNFADTRLNVLQSYVFFGACIILFFLFDISRKLTSKKSVIRPV